LSLKFFHFFYIAKSEFKDKIKIFKNKIYKMNVLRNLAKKGEQIKEKFKQSIYNLSKNVYNYISTKADNRLFQSVQQYYKTLKGIPYSTLKFVKNLGDKLVFRFRKPTSQEIKEEPEMPLELSEDLIEEPLTAQEDIDRFSSLIKQGIDIKSYSITNPIILEGEYDEVMDRIYTVLIHFLEKFIEDKKINFGFNARLEAICDFLNEKDHEITERRVTSLSQNRKEVFVGSFKDLNRVIKLLLIELNLEIEKMYHSASNCKFERFKKVIIRLFYYKNPSPLIEISPEESPKGMKYRELPEWIKNSKSITNIKNNDEKCFCWCILRHFHPDSMKTRNHNLISKDLKDNFNNFKWFGLDDPKTFSEEGLCEFEDTYKLSVVIFKIDEEPGYKVIHLRHHNEERENIFLGFYIDHYFLIRNINGFIGCAVRKIYQTTQSFYVCSICYQYFSKVKYLKEHTHRCQNDPPIYEFPKKKFNTFCRWHATLRYPAVVYADFEATNIPCTETNVVSKQIPNSFCLFCPSLNILEVRYSNVPGELFNEFWSILKSIHNQLLERQKLNKKLTQKITIPENTPCKFCGSPSNIVRHHDHFTGQFICFLCDKCNKKIKEPKDIRIFFS
jgi:hypothetical protein